MVYGAAVVALSACVQSAIILRGGPLTQHALLVCVLMWTPAVAMVVARLVLREGLLDVSFRLGTGRGGWHTYLIAWLFPPAVGLLAYGIGWTSGLIPFAVPVGGLLERHAGGSAPQALAVSIGLNLTVGTLLAAITATGEELGWRGYMTSRLIDAELPRPALLSGLLWAAWHSPLILSGQYAAGPSPLLSTSMFFLAMIGQGYLFTKVRMQSGSVWPAVLLHSAWNAVIQGTFDTLVPGHNASHAGSYWVGEAGVLVVAVELMLIAAILRRPFPLRRHPSDPEPNVGCLRSL